MTVYEERFMETVPHTMKEIANQLKLMNKLKILELRDKFMVMEKSAILKKSLADLEKDVYNS